jgi:DNA processing protein
VRILYPGHKDYPFDPKTIRNCPQFLSCLGEVCWNSRHLVSVIGSREPSSAALAWMDLHLSEFLKSNDVVLVSGGARGVDQKAHFLALRAQKPTVVFLPSGLAQPYPAEWKSWHKEVVRSGGALISTFSPFQGVRKHHFEQRNQLIAAIGQLLLVVEARRRSGSSMTARLAKEINRTICCLPGSPMDSRCFGNLDLLFDGALPIRDASDLGVLLSMSVFLSPRTLQTEYRRNRENQIGDPHCNDGNNLPLASGSFASYVDDPIRNDQANTDHSAAAFGVAAIGGGAKTDANQSE